MNIPALRVKKNNYLHAKRLLKAFTFDSVVNCKRYQDLNPSHELHSSHKYILLDPDTFNLETLDDNVKKDLRQLVDSDLSESLESLPIQLDYSDYKFDDIMKAVIPDDLLNENVNVKSYSVIGHIAHFNLRDKILDYKHLIGNVLLDKIPNIKTVVNKINEIDNTYRNFNFEILAGINNTSVECKENGCLFRFDFANVYWNPRLGTEHERVVNLFKPNDVVYDVFAGVGPFSIPAIAKQKCFAVLANDLNPNSFKYLTENYNLNSRSKLKKKELDERKEFIKLNPPSKLIVENNGGKFRFDINQTFVAFNLDGRDFVTKKLKYHFVEMLNYQLKYHPDCKFYVLMNLPALSVEFLDAFKNLYDENESKLISEAFDENTRLTSFLNVFCYHFCKNSDEELQEMQRKMRQDLGVDSLKINSKFVRKVAPNKDMFCSMFGLSLQNLVYHKSSDTYENGNNKKKLDCAEDDTENRPPSKVSKTD